MLLVFLYILVPIAHLHHYNKINLAVWSPTTIKYQYGDVKESIDLFNSIDEYGNPIPKNIRLVSMIKSLLK